MLWFGWFGFNPGSELAQQALCTHRNDYQPGCAAGGLAAILTTWIKLKKPDVGMTMNGILAGLVAITAPCASVSPAWSLAIGFIAGVLVVLAVDVIETRFKVDDPVGAISVHGICGAWGTVAVGLFAAEGGLFTSGSLSLLGTQLTGVVATFAFVFPLMFVFGKVLDRVIGMRVSEAVEIRGLDTMEFGGDAYPEFVRE